MRLCDTSSKPGRLASKGLLGVRCAIAVPHYSQTRMDSRVILLLAVIETAVCAAFVRFFLGFEGFDGRLKGNPSHTKS